MPGQTPKANVFADRLAPIEAGRRLLKERFAGASLIFVAGSVIRGEGTASSDLDLVVVYTKLK